MDVRISDSLIDVHLNAVAAAIDAASGPGKLRLYTGSMPAKGAAITTQTLIAECLFATNCAASIFAGTLTFNPLAAGLIVATGTIVWARILDGDDGFVMDMDVGDSGSSAAIKLSTTVIGTTGGYLEITDAALRWPA